jgi:hypothetical protein
MAYNQSFRLSQEVTKITRKKDAGKVTSAFRATNNGSNVTLDFGPGTPQIELTIDGDAIIGRFIVAPS